MAAGAKMVSLIPIRKMDRAIAFYTKTMGGKVRMRASGPMKNLWAALTVGGADVWLVSPGVTEKRKLAYHSFVVKDIKKYVAGLRRHGVKFDKAEKMSPETRIDGPIAFDEFGASAFFKDSEGNLLMAWQDMMSG
jgi:predicted enzyme related to lactoylglutathione lyase